MPCNEVVKAEAKLQKLFPGVLGDDVAAKLESEMENYYENEPVCIFGIEFHFKRCGYRTRTKRRAVKLDCDGCTGICIVMNKRQGDID